jgi:hypothetical protein
VTIGEGPLSFHLFGIAYLTCSRGLAEDCLTRPLLKCVDDPAYGRGLWLVRASPHDFGPAFSNI